jgi:plastocyanin
MRSQCPSLVKSVKRATVFVAVPLSVLAIGGCGGDNNSDKTNSGTAATNPTTTGAAPTTTTTPKKAKGTVLSLQADQSGALRFDKKTLDASAGKVTIDMKNPSPVQHNVVIEGNGVDKSGPVVSSGGTSTVSAALKAGKYTFYCSVDGHEQAGMKGTLTVK